MTLFSSFYSGLSGLNAYSLAMNVIGNNIANINTVGFKAGISIFQDLFSRTLSGPQRAFQIGLGVNLSDVATSLAQGAFQSTASPLDVAIQGNGMFILKENLDSQNNLYSRAGNFGINDQGYLVTQSGLLVQGKLYEGNTLNDTIEAIKIYAGQTMNATKTTEITLAGNLNADEEPPPPTAPTDIIPDDPTSYNFKQTIRIFDSQGGEHTVQICFRKTDNNEWDWEAFVDESEVDEGTPPLDFFTIGNGTLTFDESGALDAMTETTYKFTFTGKEPIADGDMDFKFGTSLSDGGTGMDGLTQMVSESSSIGFYSQNGLASGELESLTIDENGTITGFFTNGQNRKIAQLSLASFANYAGLSKLGNNVFGETFASGSANQGVAGLGGLGKLVSNALEMSNVDLAREFTSMITGQRGFQANSRIITTTDEMIQEALMIKR